ncbi:MAG: hypothetical protein ACUVTL_10880 [Thermoproteota archaeon]
MQASRLPAFLSLSYQRNMALSRLTHILLQLGPKVSRSIGSVEVSLKTVGSSGGPQNLHRAGGEAYLEG